ncbi:PQQ-dependent dehydrogenase, methanol/ethanol family [Roseobacter sp.]|uniref:PQQ-dependent dehydrogenase, methanol/ethanol family n=1 Tax=Roseobacter sp. TaxID=1907202 RepID=UPI00385905BA
MKSLFTAAVVTAIGMATFASAQSEDDLAADASTPGDVLVYGMGYDQKRFSALDQITTENVSDLTPVWAYSLGDTRGQESFPLIKDGVMYATTHSSTFALDAATGKQLWKSSVDYPAEAPRVACCGIVNRGVAMLDGVLFRTTLDAHIIAIDAATGKELWRTKSIDYKQGYSFTVTPLVADGVLIVGISGGEYGIRGYIEGYDPKTGERLWRTYTIPEPGQPGSETWPEGDAWERGGGPAWLTGSYDPDLNLVYWGVGNAASWNAQLRPGDNLYTSSVVAMNPKNGEIQWHYQFSPNDPFDHDGTNELVLAELDGRKVMMQANRNGFYYVIDRTNGELIAANPFVDKLNWAEKIDLATGRPVHTDVYQKAISGEPTQFWPSAFGGKNWSPVSYHPDLNTVFVNTFNVGMNYKAVEPKYRAGVFYFGAEFTWEWPDGPRGDLRAIDPMTGKAKWTAPSDIPRTAGVLSTGGGVVFTGAQTGEFEAFDAESGAPLWSFNTGSGIIGQPVTWEMNGMQYVSILNGSGGVYPLFSGDERLADTPAGGSVWTFALPQ